MHFKAVILPLLASVGLTTATCHKSGEYWSDAGVKRMEMYIRNTLCDSASGDNMAGAFGANQLKTKCLLLDGGRHADVEIQRLGSAGSLSIEDCREYLYREVSGCPQGGRRSYDNWMFSADPNNGPC